MYYELFHFCFYKRRLSTSFCHLNKGAFQCVPEEVLLDWLRVGVFFILVFLIGLNCIYVMCFTLSPIPTEGANKSFVSTSLSFWNGIRRKKQKADWFLKWVILSKNRFLCSVHWEAKYLKLSSPWKLLKI